MNEGKNTLKIFQLRKKYFLEIIDGMEMDAKENMVSPTESQLKIYCQRVASAVGLLSIKKKSLSDTLS